MKDRKGRLVVLLVMIGYAVGASAIAGLLAALLHADAAAIAQWAGGAFISVFVTGLTGARFIHGADAP